MAKDEIGAVASCFGRLGLSTTGSTDSDESRDEVQPNLQLSPPKPIPEVSCTCNTSRTLADLLQSTLRPIKKVKRSKRVLVEEPERVDDDNDEPQWALYCFVACQHKFKYENVTEDSLKFVSRQEYMCDGVELIFHSIKVHAVSSRRSLAASGLDHYRRLSMPGAIKHFLMDGAILSTTGEPRTSCPLRTYWESTQDLQ